MRTTIFQGPDGKERSPFAYSYVRWGLGFSASAQQTAPPLNPKDVPYHLVIPSHGASTAAALRRASAGTPEAATALNTTPGEIVVHNFVSPPNGAYPAWGVIRDSAGNLYGTTTNGGGTLSSCPVVVNCIRRPSKRLVQC
jgi:hypothetical protein